MKAGPNGRKVRSARYGVGSRWAVNWVDGGKKYRRSYTTKDAAEAALAELQVSRRDGTYVSPDASRKPLQDLWPDWLTTKAGRTPKTLSSYESLWEAHINDRWGLVPVGEISGHDIEVWLGQLRTTRTTDDGAKLKPVSASLTTVPSGTASTTSAPSAPLL